MADKQQVDQTYHFIEVAFTSSGREIMQGNGLSFAPGQMMPSFLCLISWLL